MDAELTLFRRRMLELEPLAYLWERHGHDVFKVCFELHREYKSMYEVLLRKEAA